MAIDNSIISSLICSIISPYKFLFNIISTTIKNQQNKTPTFVSALRGDNYQFRSNGASSHHHHRGYY